MKCRTCSAESYVIRTTKTARADIRQRECACGDRWESVERETPGTRYRAATNSRLIAAPAQPRSGPVAALAPSRSDGGVGGCLSFDLGLSGMNPAPSEPPSQTRTRVRRIKPAPNYTAVFEELWSATGRRGGKEQALEAWEMRGKPDPGEVLPVWLAYLGWLPEWRSPKDLSSWLNKGWHLEDWKGKPRDVDRRPSAVPFAVAAEDSRKERHTAGVLDRLREELRPKVKPTDPRQEHRELMAARAAGVTK